MELLQVKKYPVKNPILRQLIKYFWVLTSNNEVNISHKLLPVNNIDIIINFSSQIKYTLGNKTQTIPKGLHFNGISKQYYTINQMGKLNVLGISFFSEGLYPFLKIPLSEFTNRTIELDLLISRFTSRIEEKISISNAYSEKFDIMENELLQLIDFELIKTKDISQLFNTFYWNTKKLDINCFCAQYGIAQRKMERIFNKYVGISPKAFQKINRFQGISNQILKKEYVDLTSLAYEYGYYDQMHFIKDFKSYVGCSPSQFINKGEAVKEILKYT